MTATMASIKDKYVDKATNNNKEYVDNVKPLYLVSQTDIMQRYLLCCTPSTNSSNSYQVLVVTFMCLLHSTVTPQILQKVQKVQSGFA